MAYKDKTKESAYRAAYRAENRDKIRAYNAAHYAANREKVLAHYAANREKVRAREAAYYWANHEKIRAGIAKRRADQKRFAMQCSAHWMNSIPDDHPFAVTLLTLNMITNYDKT